MMRKWKRSLASLLSVAVLLGTVTVSALAAEEPEVEAAAEIEYEAALAAAAENENSIVTLAEDEGEDVGGEPEVASFNGVNYATLQIALEVAAGASEDNQAVKLLETVWGNFQVTRGNITLDLGDYTIHGSVTNEKEATLTITTTGMGGIQQQNGSVIINRGIMTINGGTYKTSINETTETYYTIINETGGRLAIEDGYVEISGGHTAYAVQSYGDELIIKAGTYCALKAVEGRAISATKGGEAKIEGGNIEGTEYGVFASGYGTVTISGGTISGGKDAVMSQKSSGVMEVTGGAFSSDVSKYVADGYTCEEVDGSFVVREGTIEYSISLDKDALALIVGAEDTLTATSAPEGEEVIWSSDNTEVATVKDGVVTAVGAGEAIITAQVGDKSATCTVTVAEEQTPEEPVSVRLNQTTLTITAGNTAQLTVTVAPEDKEVVWTSNNESVATVENGVVTAVAAGTATITASVEDKSATCAVTVQARTSDTGNTGNTGNTGSNTGNTGSNTGTDTGRPSTSTGTGTDSTVNAGQQEEDLIDNETPLVEKPFLFKDVSTKAWYYEAVKYVYNEDMMGAMNRAGDVFGPAINTTRGMVVTILWRLEGEPEAQSAGFSDVPDNQWYAAAVAWGVANGVVKGYNKTTFGPNNDVTREELAVILYRYAQLKGYNVNARHDLSRFSDNELVHAWAADAMQWAVATGLLQGSGNRLNPRNGAARCEVAQILMRFCKTFPVDK